MNELQKRLLNALQGQLPTKPRPFAALAEQLDSTEAEVIEKIEHHKHLFTAHGDLFEREILNAFSSMGIDA